MNKLIKPIRELDAAARKKLEEVLQAPVSEDQQVVLEPAESEVVSVVDSSVDPLAKYRVYEGLSEQEIEDLEKMILNRDDWD